MSTQTVQELGLRKQLERQNEKQGLVPEKYLVAMNKRPKQASWSIPTPIS